MLFYSISKFLENPYREDLVVKITFILSLIINVVIWLTLYFKLYPFSYMTEYGQIFLHYNVYFGIDNIGQWYMPFTIPLLGLFIILFNNILAYIFYLREKIIAYILLISQAVLHLVLLAAAIFVILLNI
jgi:hypothetical protein